MISCTYSRFFISKKSFFYYCGKILLNFHYWMVCRLVQIGEEFCGSESVEIQNSIRDQSSHYFRKYHSSRLEELRLFLENEAWHPCPVKPIFNLLHLQVRPLTWWITFILETVLKSNLHWQEFKSLRNIIQNASYKKNHKRTDSLDRSSTISSGYFSKFADSGTPFDIYSTLDSSYMEEDILLDEVSIFSFSLRLPCYSDM